jgi:hypothetical protein
VADKITLQLTDALSRAAAHPAGLPLYAGKADPGLFPNTSAAKPAAQKCLAEGLLRLVGADSRGRSPRDLYTLTDAGWEFLLAQVNPKQVLEDFVRVLEARQGEVGELLDTARRMADSLQGLKDAVARVLPVVTATRVVPEPAPANPERAPLGAGRNGPPPAVETEPEPVPTAVAVLDPEPETDLAPFLLARLADWSGAAGEDCPLPELFRSLSVCDPTPTIGQFHDCLRRLVAAGSVALHSWTGPLYALPEPAYALLVGHGIAYYASLRSAP